ncbi:ribose 5-phosphate isomerase B [Vagococcus sp. BWB3-3]|uniref:Ribose 5-phosphate isomerase B n=1 Tax=Vagococcus allomyrinae TaxID=2794353 RepID=A0A940PBB7_9ENTE|nr:ribose 5-phosphate isomerase B [Vagococcus allomyrinae]MBP1039563.1 ribose 5-phosphate isomerase B [Vagococcus allomyrinae]
MKLVIANDHGGKKLKDAIMLHLRNQHIEITDLGVNQLESVDYPAYAQKVGNMITEHKATLGILCCGTGIGMSIAANKLPGVRAAVVSDTFSAQATREHNHSNVLCLGERVIGEGLALLIVDTWLKATPLAGRHLERVKQLDSE